jgi:hypothetical protein
MRLLSLLSITCLLAACAAESADDGNGDVGDSLAFTSAADTGGCSQSRDQILAAAKTAGRKQAITRGLSWFDQKVPYSQSKSFQGYRTDCSGFVSMCWELGSSLTTADLISNNSSSSLLGSYDDLLPGDALVRRVGGEGHVMLFLGWNDAKKGTACVVEQRSTKLGMQFHTRTSSELKSDSYKPIRASKLTGGSDDSSGAASGAGDDDDETAAPPPDDSADGQQCFLQCIQPNAVANKYVQCSMKCQDQTCDDSCFKQFCGKTQAACEQALDGCDQQCGTAPPPN